MSRFFHPSLFLCTILLFELLQCTLGKVHVHYISADEVEWDFAPSGVDQLTHKLLNDTNAMSMLMGEIEMSPLLFSVNGIERIGRKNKKALYIEYTDETFTKVKSRPPEWSHLGYLGPLLRAEVGDTIELHFFNNVTFPCSIHPHGVQYTKEHEGINPVAPGKSFTYKWTVPNRAGPQAADLNSRVWIYHSHGNPFMDVNTGLVGCIIITAKGFSTPSGRPVGVTREVVTLFTIVDENMSWYLNQNIKNYIPGYQDITTTQMDMDMEDMDMNGNKMEDDKNKHHHHSRAVKSLAELKADPGFVKSNKKHSINGYIYANVPNIVMTVNDTVRWYLLSIGNDEDLHSAHWHGSVLSFENHLIDTIDIIPASMKTLELIPDTPGEWMFHCHVDHHVLAGMTSVYRVFDCETPCPLSVGSSLDPTKAIEDFTIHAHEEVWIERVTLRIVCLILIMLLLAMWYKVYRTNL